MNKLVIAFLLGAGFWSFGQAKFEKQTFNGSKGVLGYQILLPNNFSPTKKYPLILFLHGSGERGSDNEMQLVHGSKLFLEEENQEKYPAIVVFPQCSGDDFWSNAEVRDGERGGRLYFLDGGEPTPSMTLTIELLDSLVSSSFVDKNRVYVGGLSMGGMGTFEIVNRRPNMFAAAFPICGGGNPASARNYADKTRFWVFHGAKDDVVFPDYSTEMVLGLIKAGANPKYSLYKDANHNSWDLAFTEPAFLPWLFASKKPTR